MTGGGPNSSNADSFCKWSGLETSGMREAKCSLLLQEEVPFEAKIKALPKQRVLVYQDKGFNPLVSEQTPDNFYVEFNGATILQLEPSRNVQHKTMPVTMTVGGRCIFTPENYQDFRVMMRTKEQSLEMEISPNGNFDWPDVSSLLLCPVCGERGPIPRDGDNRDHEYWMVFYPLLQICLSEQKNQMTLGTRTICRLVCLECMEDLLEGLSLRVQPGGSRAATSNGVGRGAGSNGGRTTRLAFTLPASDVLAEAGSASFLEDGPPRPDTHPHVDDILDSWTLYNLWEHSGAWEALQNDYRIVLSKSMNGGGGADDGGGGGRDGGANNAAAAGGGAATAAAAGVGDSMEDYSPNTVTPEPRLKERMGRSCGNPQCGKVHGRPDTTTGQVTRLGIKCRDCLAEFYCSKACRETARAAHRTSCERKQRDREERREKKAKKVECHTCKQKFPFTKMKKCSRCRQATYCSVECQRADWETHKSVCIPIAPTQATTTASNSNKNATKP